MLLMNTPATFTPENDPDNLQAFKKDLQKLRQENESLRNLLHLAENSIEDLRVLVDVYRGEVERLMRQQTELVDELKLVRGR